MLVMTDGQTNQMPSGWTLPGGLQLGDWTDYDGDGDADYTTTDTNKQYAFYQAVQAAQARDHDPHAGRRHRRRRDLMQAIAYRRRRHLHRRARRRHGGRWRRTCSEAFGQIASKVPPAKLVYELSARVTARAVACVADGDRRDDEVAPTSLGRGYFSVRVLAPALNLRRSRRLTRRRRRP